jgi:hypothetical protein
MVVRKVVPFDEFYYQLKLTYLFLLHVVYFYLLIIYIGAINIWKKLLTKRKVPRRSAGQEVCTCRGLLEASFVKSWKLWRLFRNYDIFAFIFILQSVLKNYT